MSTVVLTPRAAAAEMRKILDSIQDNPELERRILLRGTLELADRARVYPAAGAWNRPPGTRGDNRWYQRQFGPRWLRANGTLNGKNTSQRLQKSWKVAVSKDSKVGSVFTGVTYAPFLLDPDRRVSWARGHGWKTTTEITDEYADRFSEMALQEIDKEIKND
jgi:hypothetical protein